MAAWRSGYAEVCKTSYTGSIPVAASNFIFARVVEWYTPAPFRCAISAGQAQGQSNFAAVVK